MILYQILCAAFCVIVVLSNIISAKMIQLPLLSDFSIPAGLITYPLTFLISDLVTEVYGSKKSQMMVYIALGMCLLSFGIIQMALWLPSSDDQNEFQATLGLSGLRIFASLLAYLTAQLVDIKLYTWIRKLTNEKYLWLRNNGSTLISQLVDTAIIDIVYLYWGLGMDVYQVLPIMVFSYAYKSFFSATTTPLLYLSLYLIRFKPRVALN